TEKGLPKYHDADESDVFILSGAEDLVRSFRKDAFGSIVRDPNGKPLVEDDEIDGYSVRRYCPRIEGLFARIERWSRKADGDVHWRSISKDNVLSLYGKDEGSRIADPHEGKRVFSWLLCETRDDKGNAVVYEYKSEDATGVHLTQAHECNRGPTNDSSRKAGRYVKRIHYGNTLSLLDNQ